MSLKLKKWLEKLGMEDYYKLFLNFSVSDAMVKCLTKDTLSLMGIENEIHREIILSHLGDFVDENKEEISELRNRKEVDDFEGFKISNINEHDDTTNEEQKPVCIKKNLLYFLLIDNWKLDLLRGVLFLIYQTIKKRYFTVHVKNNSLDDALSKICPVGSECEYSLNEKLINELKKKYN